MKAVLGLLLILVGFTVGWLVITGKLPPTTTTSQTVPGVTPSPAPQTTPRNPTIQQASTRNVRGTPKL